MMKILTQKMLGAQGLDAGCQDFVIWAVRGVFEIPAVPRIIGAFRVLSFRAKREICVSGDAGDSRFLLSFARRNDSETGPIRFNALRA
jgi:hypothetical protein